jgi:hypothetical protein
LPDEEFLRIVQATCREVGPQTVEQLASRMEEQFQVSRKEILETLFRLQRDGKISLRQPLNRSPSGFSSFMKTEQAIWYWITLTISLVSMLVVLFVREDSFPLAYIRNGLGAFTVIFLPGYAFTEMLFPRTSSLRKENSLDLVERVALSLLMSLVVVILVGLVLNYTVFGIAPTPAVLCLMILTVTFATVGIARQFSFSVRKLGEELIANC